METTVKLLLVSGDQIVRFGAVVVILYFAYVLRRARIDGASYLVLGCLAILMGEGAKVVSFTGMGPSQAWFPALLLTSLGSCSAAFGFAKLVRFAVSRQ